MSSSASIRTEIIFDWASSNNKSFERGRVTQGPLTQEVKRFINEHINSVFQVEVLLLLHSQKEKAWSAEAVDRELGIGLEEAQIQLDDLCSRGLFATEEGHPSTCRYSPASDQLDQAVSALAKAYSERRVNVLSSIFSKPVDKVRLFAEAFRIRK